MQASHYITTKLGPVKVGDNVRVKGTIIQESMTNGKLGVITEIDTFTGVLRFKYVDDNENVRLVDILPSDIVGIIMPVDPTEEVEDDDEVDEDLGSHIQECLRDWEYPQVGECKFASLYNGCGEEVCSTNTAQKTKRLFISSMV